MVISALISLYLDCTQTGSCQTYSDNIDTIPLHETRKSFFLPHPYQSRPYFAIRLTRILRAVARRLDLSDRPSAIRPREIDHAYSLLLALSLRTMGGWPDSQDNLEPFQRTDNRPARSSRQSSSYEGVDHRRVLIHDVLHAFYYCQWCLVFRCKGVGMTCR